MTDPYCCKPSTSSFGVFHALDCPAFCPAHATFDCLEPDPPHYADVTGQLIPADPRRVLSFTGTRCEFLLWLEAMVDLQDVAGVPPEFVPLDAGETYEWELTASISRHPAGKGLRAGD